MAQRRVPVQLLAGSRGRIPVAELRRVARYVLDSEDVAPPVEVEVVLADEATVRNLNRLYRGKDEPTDVLSFATSDSARPEALEGRRAGAEHSTNPDRLTNADTGVAFIDPPDATPSLGEVIICVPVAEQQARDQGHAVAGAICHLLVHGLLHLLGYDHEESESDSQAMKSREDELLSELGYAGSYEHGH